MELENLIVNVQESLNSYSDMNPEDITSLREVAENLWWALARVEEYLLNEI